MPKAFCVDCDKLISEKDYSQPQNPQIKCPHCDKKGGHIAYEETQSTTNSDVDTLLGGTENDKPKEPLKDSEVIQLKVEEINLDSNDSSLKNFATNFQLPKNVTDLKNKPIRIKLEEKTLNSLYNAVDKLGQELEKRTFNKKEATYYGNPIFKDIYSAFSKIGSQISKQIDLPIAKVFVLAHIAILAPIPVMLLKSLRNLRGNKDEQELE